MEGEESKTVIIYNFFISLWLRKYRDNLLSLSIYIYKKWAWMFKAWGEGLGMKKARVIVLGSENGNDEEELSGTAYLQEKLNRSDVWSRDLENVLWSMS